MKPGNSTSRPEPPAPPAAATQISGLLPGLTALIWSVSLSLAQDFNSNSLPTLAPPHGALEPGFWERNWHWAALAGVLALAIIGGVLWLLCRPKPPVVIPPETQARREFEALGRLPESGAVLSRVSQTFRQYVIAAFGLPSGELTTAEFCAAIAGHDGIGPELAKTAGEFLRRCDERKFAPGSAGPPLGAAAEALRLVDLAEARRAVLAQAARAKESGARG